MKRGLLFLLLLFFLLSVNFSWGGEFTFELGYNYDEPEEIEAFPIELFQKMNVDTFFDAQTDYGYFYADLSASFFHGITMDASTLLANPLLHCNATNEGLLPSFLSLSLGNDRFMLNLNELYYEYAFKDYTLRLGRFKLQKGSGTLYSPSDVLSPTSMLDISFQPKKEAIDGVLLQGFYDNFDMEVFLTPFTRMNLPTYNTLLNTLEKDYYLQYYAQNLISMIDEPIAYIMPARNEYVFEKDYPLNFNTLNFGAKFGFTFFDLLWKAGYYRDHFHFQVPTWISHSYQKVPASLTNPATGASFTSKTEFVIPKRNTFTVDIQGDLFDSATFYIESAFMIAQDLDSVLRFDYNYYATSTLVDTFDKKTIFKGLAGIEYTGAITGLGLEEDELRVGVEIFNSLPNEFFSFSPGIDSYLRINKGDFDFEGLVAIAFTEIEEEFKPGYSLNAFLTYSGLDLLDVVVSAAFNYSEFEEHPFHMQKGLLNNISIGAKGYF